MSGECVASVRRLDINGSWKLHAMPSAFQESLPILHVILLGKALYKSKVWKSGVWCPWSIIMFMRKRQWRGHVVLLLPSARQKTAKADHEWQPRSTNPYGHERCCVHEVNFRASSCWYTCHLPTLPIPPAHQELILLSKTTISTTHGRGVVALVS